MQTVRISILKMLALCFLILAFPAFSEENKEVLDLQKSYEKIQEKFDRLDKNKLKISDLDDIQKENASLQLKMDECISSNTTLLENVQKNLKLLGEKQQSEETDIINKRKELDEQIQAFDKELKRCTLLKIQLNQISENISQQRQNLLKAQLLSRELSVPSALQKLAKLDNNLVESESNAILPVTEKIISTFSWPLVLLLITGLAIGFIWKRQGHYSSSKVRSEASSPTLVSTMRGIERTSHLLFSVILIWLYLYIQDDTPPIILNTLFYSLLLIITFAVIRGVVFPERLSTSTNTISRKTIVVMAWTFIAFTVITYTFNHEASGRYSSSAILYFIWLISLILGALSFIVVLWMLVRKIFSERTISTAYLIPMGSMLIAIIAAMSGYRNFSSLLYFGTINSLILLVIAFFFLRISNEFFDSLDEGKIAWQHKLRMAMSIEDGRAFPGILWLRILFFFFLVFIGVSALIFIWGGSQQQISTLFLSLKDGFTIGTVKLDLLNIFYAILIMIVALSILPIIKNQLVASWLKHSNLSRGAIEATQTLVGYGGVAIAILLALYVLGVNFQNLAIIAGALSVGIGFGLQNIVNNFVSGIILLFERPIRRGDWIVVGSTEGYVKDISIRSTVIQTFERADVIVPNSELISSQVTNWMLSNTVGRLTAPIGVAYGSDVDQVIAILEKVASSHPEVIKNHPDYPIRVLFLAFGDSSLNFELRCFIKNVDIRLSTLSSINLSIDREFRNANIEIPFPQRVVHMQKDS